MTCKTDILLVTPPLLQPNTAYPATAYLKSYLGQQGFRAEQYDLSIQLLNAIFSAGFLTEIFDRYTAGEDPNIQRIFRLRASYTGTIEPVIRFLQGNDPTVANLICSADFLPQAGRFEFIEDIETAYGTIGMIDCAKYLATLYLEDIADFLRATVAPHFGLVRYAEKISLSVPEFALLETELAKPLNPMEERMLELLEEQIREKNPNHIGFTIPFPGNLLSALQCARHIKKRHPGLPVIFGGGYPTTELRSLTDAGIFQYVDYIVLDGGEIPLRQLLSGEKPVRTFTCVEGRVIFSGHPTEEIHHRDRGCPDLSGLPWEKYFSLVDTANPMQRLWSDGRWNKMILAHGCYWAQCAFCDTSLDYICRYEALDAVTVVDYMERMIAQSGQTGFHFVDEAAPPRLLKEMALEIIRRGLKVSWWGNIRFESAFTGDLCLLLAASGCIAVSGGVETASNRLLEKMNKGVSIEQLTLVLRNFYYAGIMVHAYLMYGFPSQTLPETVDALEVVRQLFQAELITSAFWHRYAMTVHAPSGKNPADFGVRIKNKPPHPFANNEIHFAEDRSYNVAAAGDSLRQATFQYMRQTAFEKPVHTWFEGRAPQTSHEPTLVTDQLIKPDGSRMYDQRARLIFVGNTPQRTADGLLFTGNAKEKSLKFSDAQADFLMEIIALVSDLSRRITLEQVKTIYSRYSEEPFLYFYHSKKWDILRLYGLWQI
ncbi:MAG: radical SAM protein [Rikenellaceae bacterium]|nr:radical SAM protein [Rikenellaceae bacterium]